jgi:hypothetical protein
MTGNTQRAFIAAHDFFTRAAFPFGTGIIAEATEKAAQAKSIRQSALLTKNQWYHLLIPAPEYFFHLHAPLKEQPFPVLHRLMSQKSLSALFYDEFAQFKWQLAAFLKDNPEEEQRLASDSEMYSSFHNLRERLLALPSGGSFMPLLTRSNNDGAITASFFDFLGIAGIQFTDSGGTRFLIANARKNIAITSIHRERITARMGENHE